MTFPWPSSVPVSRRMSRTTLWCRRFPSHSSRPYLSFSQSVCTRAWMWFMILMLVLRLLIVLVFVKVWKFKHLPLVRNYGNNSHQRCFVINGIHSKLAIWPLKSSTWFCLLQFFCWRTTTWRSLSFHLFGIHFRRYVCSIMYPFLLFHAFIAEQCFSYFFLCSIHVNCIVISL